MKTIESEGPYQAVTIGLGPEEKLLESIKEAIKRHDIRNGAVVARAQISTRVSKK